MEDEVVFQSNMESWPHNYPTLTTLQFAQQTTGFTWWSAIMDLMNSFKLRPLPTLLGRAAWVSGFCTARMKALLVQYRVGSHSTFCSDTVTGAPLAIPGVIYMVFRGSGRSLCAAQHVDVGHVLLISGQGTVQILRQCWEMRCLGRAPPAMDFQVESL